MRRAGHFVPTQLYPLFGNLDSLDASEPLGQPEGITVLAQRSGPPWRWLRGGSPDVAAGPV